jgi:hypothetical protein
MARKKGSRDLTPRKKARHKPTTRTAAKPPTHEEAQHEMQTAAETPPNCNHVATDSEFDAAVTSVLGNDSLSREGAGARQAAGAPDQPPSPPPAAIEESMVLGIDAWEAIVQAPFRSLAIMLRIPAFEQLGKLRAKMVAQPSYPLYRHYVTQWLTDNPDDELFIAKIMTGAALSTVLQEGWMIWTTNRAVKRAWSEGKQMVKDAGLPPVGSSTPPTVGVVNPKTVRVDQLHTDN